MRPRVTVIRHPMENLAKCSLTPLHGRAGFSFHSADRGFALSGDEHTLLQLDSPLLSEADAGRPLLLLDSTWHRLPRVRGCVTGSPTPRTLPPVPTAYPRVSKLYEDPQGGLASVEAVYLALRVMGLRDDSLLDGYRWSEQFLASCEAHL